MEEVTEAHEALKTTLAESDREKAPIQVGSRFILLFLRCRVQVKYFITYRLSQTALGFT